MWSAIPGSMTLRHLTTYQPVLETQNLPGTAFNWTSQPKTRSSGNFLVAAESRVRSASSFWEDSHGDK